MICQSAVWWASCPPFLDVLLDFIMLMSKIVLLSLSQEPDAKAKADDGGEYNCCFHTILQQLLLPFTVFA